MAATRYYDVKITVLKKIEVGDIALGHDYPWIKQKGTEIFCCADGLHPILYKLERIENSI
ncbi:hypothetical protein [Pelosinus sp. UFO1]|uniref:hypothetical protein n=1 Tax=Pelosinus sp. UFO1 TaxID=484770 RepID=UPI0004D14422|nr:hypothetical protein [Pelosinus sp. UFO1]AIF51560.1 hypothetical protein UFO1_2013 [Pelosinus sp. UFO1]